jgi:hypothetical protein
MRNPESCAAAFLCLQSAEGALDSWQASDNPGLATEQPWDLKEVMGPPEQVCEPGKPSGL